MRKMLSFLISTAQISGCFLAVPTQTKQSKVFQSKGGWKATYPSSWRIESCHNCTDPHAAGVYVDFLPPQSKKPQGWVMIEPLADKPQAISVEAWLAQLATDANQNRHVHEKSTTINSLPALRVRYITPQAEFMEAVYVIFGSKAVSISFSGEKPDVPLESLRNYLAFNEIVRSFHMQ